MFSSDVKISADCFLRCLLTTSGNGDMICRNFEGESTASLEIWVVVTWKILKVLGVVWTSFAAVGWVVFVMTEVDSSLIFLKDCVVFRLLL